MTRRRSTLSVFVWADSPAPKATRCATASRNDFHLWPAWRRIHSHQGLRSLCAVWLQAYLNVCSVRQRLVDVLLLQATVRQERLEKEQQHKRREPKQHLHVCKARPR